MEKMENDNEEKEEKVRGLLLETTRMGRELARKDEEIERLDLDLKAEREFIHDSRKALDEAANKFSLSTVAKKCDYCLHAPNYLSDALGALDKIPKPEEIRKTTVMLTEENNKLKEEKKVLEAKVKELNKNMGTVKEENAAKLKKLE